MDKEYIERGALLQDIEESVRFTVRPDRPSAEIRGANKITDRIKSAPTADVVEVRHGEWKIESDPINDPKGYFIRIVCSECGLKTGQKSNYCPNCGADMRGKKDE